MFSLIARTSPEDAKIPYQEFLKDRLAIRAMVDADCEIYDIPTDL